MNSVQVFSRSAI